MADLDSAFQWHKTVDDVRYLVSTSKKLVSRDYVQFAFGHKSVYWAKPASSPENLQILIENSCVFGLYALKKTASDTSPRTEDLTQIGFARLITDYMTFAYLTDVFITPEYQGKGLGKWMTQCCGERAEAMPEIRAVTLLTGVEKSKRFYEAVLGVKALESGASGLSFMMRRFREIELDFE